MLRIIDLHPGRALIVRAIVSRHSIQRRGHIHRRIRALLLRRAKTQRPSLRNAVDRGERRATITRMIKSFVCGNPHIARRAKVHRNVKGRSRVPKRRGSVERGATVRGGIERGPGGGVEGGVVDFVGGDDGAGGDVGDGGEGGGEVIVWTSSTA